MLLKRIDPRLLNSLLFLLALHLLNFKLDEYDAIAGKKLLVLSTLVFTVFALIMQELIKFRIAHRMASRVFSSELKERFSVNPFRHFDFLSFLVLLLSFVSFTRPLPLRYRDFPSPRKALLFIHIGGLFYFLVGGFVFSIFLFLGALGELPLVLLQLLQIMTVVHLKLFIFNLLPLPPLAGASIVMALLPLSATIKFAKTEKYGPWILLVLAFLNLIRPWVFTGTTYIFENLPTIVSIIDLQRHGSLLQ
jgi:Zn-dependent protease